MVVILEIIRCFWGTFELFTMNMNLLFLWSEKYGGIRGPSPCPPTEILILQPFMAKNTFMRAPESSQEIPASSKAQNLRTTTMKRARTVSLYSCHPFPELAQHSTERYSPSLWFLPQEKERVGVLLPQFSATQEACFSLVSPRILRVFAFLDHWGSAKKKEKGPSLTTDMWISTTGPQTWQSAGPLRDPSS